MASEAGDQSAEQLGRYYEAINTEWRNIQKNAFCRWANERLKTVDMEISDLETDFCDGVRLIRLAEALSGVTIKQRFNAKPRTRTQKLENVTMCLQFLERQQKLRIVNIGQSELRRSSF